MLRASSLGLSYPLTTISALHTCRWLYGARSRWVSHSRHASSGSGKSVSPEAAHHASASAHRQRRQPQPQQKQSDDPLRTSQDMEDVITQEENRHVAYARQHRRLLQMGGQVEEENTLLHRTSSSALLEGLQKETLHNDRVGTTHVSASDSSMSESTVATTNRIWASQLSEGNLHPGSSSESSRENLRRRPQRQVVQERPSHAVGRPWSPDPISRVEIPNKIKHFLMNIENGLKRAHASCMKLLKEKEEKEKNLRKPIVAEPSSQKIDDTPEGSNELADLESLPPVDIITDIREHLETLGTSDSVNDSWASYTYLIDTISCHPIIYNRLKHIPYSHLHRFVRLLSRNRPRTHIQYLRLLSVMTYIVHVGGTLKQHEWNALIDHVGAGRRTTVADDMDKALAAFRSISAGRLPGSSDFDMNDVIPTSQSSFEPDVYTMTILLSLAARAHDAATLKQISNVMVQTGIMPNRITHLSLLRYFTERKDLGGVRRTLQKMRQNDLELGVDGLNACIWAFGNNNRLDVSLMIYRALRHNTLSPGNQALDDVHPLLATLQEESIYVEDDMIPNEITYTSVIQVMAYHGQFVPTIKIFIDMLSTKNLEYGAPVEPSESQFGTPDALPYSPTIAIYRAVFLGFSKHGKHPSMVRDPDELDWTLKNLLELFDRFLAMPSNTPLTHSVVHIIMTAFVQTSGGDMDVMRQAWSALDKRFGIVFHKEHTHFRLMKMKRALFPDSQPK